MSLVLSHQSLYQSQSTSLSNTNTNTNTNRRRFKNDDEDQEEARVSEGVVGSGREVLFFVPSSIGSCCFLLLVACLLGVSLVSRVSCERELHFFISLV